MSLNSYQLKSIALVSMLVDHFAVVFSSYFPKTVYYTLRSLGRLAFPLYCFLLVEGFFHTKNRKKYLIRLLLFSLVSEIPFDLALQSRHMQGNSFFYGGAQNVFFTLSIGFLAMILLEAYRYNNYNSSLSLLIILLTVYLGDRIHCDYGGLGVMTIIAFYMFRRNTDSWSQYRLSLFLCLIPLFIISFTGSRFQLFCFFSLFFMQAYNEKKGHGPKYLFYLAFPGHLILFYMIKNLFLS